MSSSIPSQLNFGAFIPTTNIWEIQKVQSLAIDPQLKEIIVRLYQNINNIAIAVNGKSTGIYDTQEFLIGDTYFPTSNQSQTTSSTPQYRPVFRKVIIFGVLPNTTSRSISHQIPINSGYIPTRIYGVATNANSTSMIPLPFASPTLNENIKLEVDATSVTITTGIDRTSYTNTYIVLEYIKS